MPERPFPGLGAASISYFGLRAGRRRVWVEKLRHNARPAGPFIRQETAQSAQSPDDKLSLPAYLIKFPFSFVIPEF